MTDRNINYAAVVEKTMDELETLIGQSYELESEIAKKQQFLNAAMNMLSEEDREKYDAWVGVFEMRDWGLTEAIRQVLQTSKGWHTATQVRDVLRAQNFYFSRYKTNPLASVHTVLKRLTDKEVQSAEIEGVTAWKWKGIKRFPRRKKK